jgi:phosphatidylglycerol:prolipoprotein diacylglycerol transferase
MHPVLTVLHVGAHALPIFSYGVFLCLGLAAAALGGLRVASRAQLDVGACIAGIGIAVAGGFAGAWLLNGLVQTVRLGSLAAGFARPGIAFFGGAIGAGVTWLWACRRMRLPGLLIVERALPAVALGHALGRIGCLLGGCCFGRPTTGLFAVHYSDPRAPAAALWLDPRTPGVALSVGRHPVPLYEALALASLAVVFALRPARHAGDGARLLAYAASYSALRIGLEFLRGDEVRGVLFGGALSTSQIVAGFVLLGCGFGWAWRVREPRPPASSSSAPALRGGASSAAQP